MRWKQGCSPGSWMALSPAHSDPASQRVSISLHLSLFLKGGVFAWEGVLLTLSLLCSPLPLLPRKQSCPLELSWSHFLLRPLSAPGVWDPV